MKKILSALVLSFVTTAFAEVSPEHVESMLAQMVRENVISAPEAEKARLRMKNLSADQWKDINKKAADVAARSPASLTPSENKIEEVHSVDLDGKQFKEIQNEMKKIVPEFRDQD
jgi:uncharacterized protein YhdP